MKKRKRNQKSDMFDRLPYGRYMGLTETITYLGSYPEGEERAFAYARLNSSDILALKTFMGIAYGNDVFAVVRELSDFSKWKPKYSIRNKKIFSISTFQAEMGMMHNRIIPNIHKLSHSNTEASILTGFEEIVEEDARLIQRALENKFYCPRVLSPKFAEQIGIGVVNSRCQYLKDRFYRLKDLIQIE